MAHRVRFLTNPDMSMEEIAKRLEMLGPEVSWRKTPGPIYGFDAFFPTREAALASFENCFKYYVDACTGTTPRIINPEDFIDNPDLEKVVALLP